MNRKSRFVFSFLLFLLFSLTSLSSSQQTQPPQNQQEPEPVKALQVKGNIYEVKGGRGANCGFFIGEKEVLVIDGKMTEESAQAMIDEIKKLTSNPIKYVVLTHSDGDHVNGLPGFPGNIDIIAHSQTREDMAEVFKEPEKKLYLPNVTFAKKYIIRSGKAQIKLLHFGPAHTSGDAVVYFPAEKVAFLGDLLFLGRDPLIHRHKNGSSFGLVKTLKAILKLDADTFVHGHGDMAKKSDAEALIKALQEKQNRIRTLIKEGKTLEEIKEIFGVKDIPLPPGGTQRPGLVETIYLELTQKK